MEHPKPLKHSHCFYGPLPNVIKITLGRLIDMLKLRRRDDWGGLQ